MTHVLLNIIDKQMVLILKLLSLVQLIAAKLIKIQHERPDTELSQIWSALEEVHKLTQVLTSELRSLFNGGDGNDNNHQP